MLIDLPKHFYVCQWAFKLELERDPSCLLVRSNRQLLIDWKCKSEFDIAVQLKNYLRNGFSFDVAKFVVFNIVYYAYYAFVNF